MIGACCLLPNLGAEEGHDWAGLRRHPAVRVAARLWSHLFSADAWLCRPSASTPSPSPADSPAPAAGAAAAASVAGRLRLERQRCGALWPAALGDPAPEPAYAWIEPAEGAVPWLATRTLAETSEAALGLALVGPGPDRVARVHDKAFALAEARRGSLLSSELESLPIALDPGELEDPEAALHRIEAWVRDWPAWTGGRFTLKPRLGSSGRGRVAGVGGSADASARESIRSAIPRLARRGGAILEPWLARRCDLSACVHLPPPEAGRSPPTLLGSLEQILSPSGGFRGHSGELDARGRVYSGHREDEAVRTSSVWLAERARDQGFFGPCGVDAFTYLEGARERLRPAVELNARATMGLVSLGLVRRALPLVRERLDLAGAARRGFLLALLSEPPSASADGDGTRDGGGGDGQARAIEDHAGHGVIRLSLAAEGDCEGPWPTLFFGPDRSMLREAHRTVMGC